MTTTRSTWSTAETKQIFSHNFTYTILEHWAAAAQRAAVPNSWLFVNLLQYSNCLISRRPFKLIKQEREAVVAKKNLG